MQSIFNRRSIRKYEDRSVEQEKVDKLLQAAFYAPSACNQQPWEYYVATNKDVIKKLAAASPYAGCATEAPVVIVPCYNKNCKVPQYAEIDLSASVQNLLLEADYLGLGAVWLAVAPEADRMKNVREVLDLPENLEAFALVPVGYPAETKEMPERFDESRVHYIK